MPKKLNWDLKNWDLIGHWSLGFGIFMIIGHKKQRQFLKRAGESGKIPHALLFSGQKNLGKKSLAVEFIKFLICNDSKRPCQICKDCKDIERGIHPDFILVEPDPLKGETQISQIRELIWKLSLRSYSSPFKTAVIDQAHLMNRQTQNCFLKTLEEPKGKSLLILVSEHPEMLLPTILSRVQKIKFSPVEKNEIEDYFVKQGFSKNKAEYLSSFSLGRPGTAIDFVSTPRKLEEQEKFISDIKKISKGNFAFRFQYAKILSEQNPKEALDVWLRYFRGLFLSCLKGDNTNRSGDYSLLKLKKIISSLLSTDYLIYTTNINSRLALEILLMEF